MLFHLSLYHQAWPAGVIVSALDLRLWRSRVQLPALHFQVTTLGKLFTHMSLCHQAVEFGAGPGAVIPCGWEGNRRSAVTLAMRHRLQWFVHLRAHGLRKGDEHPAFTSRRVSNTISYLLCHRRRDLCNSTCLCHFAYHEFTRSLCWRNWSVVD